MTTLFDIYAKGNFTENYYLTIHSLSGETEVKIYKNFKAVYNDIMKDIPPQKMMKLEVVDKRIEGKMIYLELVEHTENLVLKAKEK